MSTSTDASLEETIFVKLLVYAPFVALIEGFQGRGWWSALWFVVSVGLLLATWFTVRHRAWEERAWAKIAAAKEAREQEETIR